jgi:glutamyl-tRNA reductase
MGSNGSLHKHVAVFGLNHASSTICVRDKLLFAESDIPEALREVRDLPGISEAVIVSTCNRVEIYTVTTGPDEAAHQLAEFLSARHKVNKSEFGPLTYFYRCEQAIEHLFKVIASLDSLIVGEGQILSQMKLAFKIAQESHATGTVFNKLFQFAITAGKRVRAETKIGEGAVSISQAGVELAKKILGRLNNRCALIIGAGEMSELTARHLKAASIGKLFFANRTLENAASLAAQFEGVPLTLAERSKVMPDCDIVISSTASPDFIIGVEEMREVVAKRKNSPILLIDIAAPRDIHPDVAKIYNVFLYTIDDLAQVAQINVQLRGGEITAALAIINDEMQKYYAWYNYLRVQPVIVQLRKKFDTLRDKKLEQCASRWANLPKDSQDFVLEFADALIAECLEKPSKNLRESSNSTDWLQLSDSIVKIFDLNADPDKKESL